MSCTEAVTTLASGDDAEISIVYPPNGELNAEKTEALQGLTLSHAAQSGFRKVIADVTATVLFHHFCILDGVGDPDEHDFDTWLRAPLSEPTGDDGLMIHDELFDTYWDYVEHI